MRSLRLFQRNTTIANMRISTRTKTPAEAKTAIIAGLLWKKDTPPALFKEDWDSRAWVGRELVVIVATVVLGPEVAGTFGAEVGRNVPEGVENVKRIEEEEEEVTEELATGELVVESEGPGSVVVLRNSVLSEMNIVAEYKLTMYSTKQTVRTVRTAR